MNNLDHYALFLEYGDHPCETNTQDTSTSPKFGLEAANSGLSYIAAPKGVDADFSYNMKHVYRTEKSIIGCDSLNYSPKEMADILKILAPGFEKGRYETFQEDQLVKVRMGEAVVNAYASLKLAKSVKYVILTE